MANGALTLSRNAVLGPLRYGLINDHDDFMDDPDGFLLDPAGRHAA